ncbi:hypothetical protein GON26_20585 [Flavobacterium sp. GA093]|uniref:Uncharacterized protein n=1 Tax=Flavobacterium hydrocarbonoxydans TaxID=2683249 RepID=A0A6I4NQU3_9FLAO|nr:hypothetical protein [Flavobacterium hydrocarbonoxydans]MWB96766.1 hypothetical protein [Flavobacterium hydrocarbonoxydans]
MKKILLLLILTFSITTIAQSKYTIEKQLQLNTVYRGDPEDSILVRSPDRIVKMISRNELGSGSGAADLDTTLKTGSNASITTDLLITAPNFNFSTNNSRGSIYNSNRGINIEGQSLGVYIDGHAGGIHLGNTPIIEFNSPTEFLQETRIKNNFIVGDSYYLTFPGTGNTGVITKSGLGPLGIYCSGGINMQGPSIKVNNHNLIVAVNGAVAAENGNIVTLATNTTTTALSNSALNSSYPQATPGFKVYCYEIFPNKTIYEKTTEGWIQYSFSVVNP